MCNWQLLKEEEVIKIDVNIIGSKELSLYFVIVILLKVYVAKSNDHFSPATSEVDFVSLSMIVSLEPTSEERQCFDIQTIDDTIVEGTEVFIVSLTNPVGVNISNREESISIDDDGDSKWV